MTCLSQPDRTTGFNWGFRYAWVLQWARTKWPCSSVALRMSVDVCRIPTVGTAPHVHSNIQLRLNYRTQKLPLSALSSSITHITLEFDRNNRQPRTSHEPFNGSGKNNNKNRPYPKQLSVDGTNNLTHLDGASRAVETTADDGRKPCALEKKSKRCHQL